MAYEKHVWQIGETIEAAELNNIEEGIETIANTCFNKGNLVNIINNNSTNEQLPTAKAIVDYFNKIKSIYNAEDIAW